MRIIRTEMYFDRARSARSRGLSVAWCKVGDRKVHPDFLGSLVRPELTVSFQEERFNYVAAEFIDHVISGRKRRYPVGWSIDSPFHFTHWEAMDFVWKQEIVLETSPPVVVPFQDLLRKSPAIVIGTAIGLSTAGPHDLLMLLTVPGGIIIVGAAIGVSKGLEGGLKRAIDNFIGGPL